MPDAIVLAAAAGAVLVIAGSRVGRAPHVEPEARIEEWNSEFREVRRSGDRAGQLVARQVRSERRAAKYAKRQARLDKLRPKETRDA